MHISYLAEHPDAVATLAAWFKHEWPDYFSDRTVDDVAEIFRNRRNTDRIPMALVALEDGHLLGTISIVDESIATHTHVGPWLAGLYVDERNRGQGVGRALLRGAIAEARSLEVPVLYTGSRQSEESF